MAGRPHAACCRCLRAPAAAALCTASTQLPTLPAAQELISFLLSPEARDLRPLLLTELTYATDLLLRDRLRRAAAAAPSLLPRPRLPFGLGALPLPPLPPPPVPVPGRGLVPAQVLVEQLAPPLSQPEEVYLQVGRAFVCGWVGVMCGCVWVGCRSSEGGSWGGELV